MRREAYLSDLKEHLDNFGMWEKLMAGELNCFVCKRKVDLDNFGMVFRSDDDYSVTCSDLDCIRAVTSTKEV